MFGEDEEDGESDMNKDREARIVEKIAHDLDWEVTKMCLDEVEKALRMAQEGHDKIYREMNGVYGLPKVVGEVMRDFQEMKVKMTGNLGELNRWLGMKGKRV